MIHNFPLDTNGIGAIKGEEILNVKILRIDQASTYYCKEGPRMKRRGVDTKSHVVKRDYMRRTEIIDQ